MAVSTGRLCHSLEQSASLGQSWYVDATTDYCESIDQPSTAIELWRTWGCLHLSGHGLIWKTRERWPQDKIAAEPTGARASAEGPGHLNYLSRPKCSLIQRCKGLSHLRCLSIKLSMLGLNLERAHCNHSRHGPLSSAFAGRAGRQAGVRIKVKGLMQTCFC